QIQKCLLPPGFSILQNCRPSEGIQAFVVYYEHLSVENWGFKILDFLGTHVSNNALEAARFEG
ncbi:hypothetical protein MUO56_03470, partial [Candidatus Bathyarchaeota archaeon]|nr:hypothetical protein [Candidatus Bathyarchaeota archaeon]